MTPATDTAGPPTACELEAARVRALQVAAEYEEKIAQAKRDEEHARYADTRARVQVLIGQRAALCDKVQHFMLATLKHARSLHDDLSALEGQIFHLTNQLPQRERESIGIRPRPFSRWVHETLKHFSGAPSARGWWWEHEPGAPAPIALETQHDGRVEG